MIGDKAMDIRTTKTDRRRRDLRSVPGYSLTELLVVMLLFSLAMTILMQTYISFNRLSHRISNAATLQQDSRFAFEYMARALRNMPVDYSWDWTGSSSTLRLYSSASEQKIIKLSEKGDAECGDADTNACLLVSVDGGVNWSPLTSKGVDVKDFKVYIQPTESPFVLTGAPADYPNDQQPFVTVEMDLVFMSPREAERVSLSTQTSISSRVYER